MLYNGPIFPRDQWQLINGINNFHLKASALVYNRWYGWLEWVSVVTLCTSCRTFNLLTEMELRDSSDSLLGAPMQNMMQFWIFWHIHLYNFIWETLSSVLRYRSTYFSYSYRTFYERIISEKNHNSLDLPNWQLVIIRYKTFTYTVDIVRDVIFIVNITSSISRIFTTEDYLDPWKEQYILDEGKRTDILVELHGKFKFTTLSTRLKMHYALHNVKDTYLSNLKR